MKGTRLLRRRLPIKQLDPAYAPVPSEPGREASVEKNGLMDAVEVARTDMRDPRLEATPVVAEYGHLICFRQGQVRHPLIHSNHRLGRRIRCAPNQGAP